MKNLLSECIAVFNQFDKYAYTSYPALVKLCIEGAVDTKIDYYKLDPKSLEINVGHKSNQGLCLADQKNNFFLTKAVDCCVICSIIRLPPK